MYTIRKATVADLSHIVTFEELLSDIHRVFDVYYGLYDDYVDLNAFLAEQMGRDDRIYFVAENKSQEIIGFASASAIIIPNSDAPKVGKFLSTFVIPEYRKKGIGTSLYEHCAAWMTNLHVDYIEQAISPKNTDVLRRAEKEGFEPYMIILKKRVEKEDTSHIRNPDA